MLRTRLFVALDFDGTLAPLAARPEAVRLPAATAQALRALAARADVRVAVVSGRPLSDLRPRVGLVRAAYAGNHGLEAAAGGWRWTHPGLGGRRAALRRVRAEARRLCRLAPGAWVEDKGASLSVHVHAVRSAAGESALAGALAAAVRRAGGLALKPGKRVYEVRPRLAWDKGRAVELLRRRLAPGAACVYVGDDVTDEDAFRRLRGKALTVKVGRGPTAAACRVAGPAAVRRLLEALLRRY
jgi:trehalose 6-phosphate phosphatase